MYRRMALGLKNASATFQPALDIVLSPPRLQCTLVYIYDIIVFKESIYDCFGEISTVLSLMRAAGFSFKIMNFYLLLQDLEYLG